MRILTCVLLFNITFSFGQVYTIDQSIPVEIDGNLLDNPWAGGLNSGQYNTMDANLDGFEDLVVFDRTANKISVFINVEGKYIYAPELANQFPSGMTNWVLLRDYNCDGKKDIFTSDPLGIRVYVNQADEDGLKWRLFNSREPQPSPLLTKGFSASPINIQLSSADIPSIEDIDNDGDLDILVFRFSSAATVEFHKNMNIEVAGNCDSLRYERTTQTWGEFEECTCGEFTFNGESCPPFGGGRVEHQSGKSLLTMDVDDDGDVDALVGEEGCVSLQLLENIGTSENALMSTVNLKYPNLSDPAAFFIYPAAYFEDIDFDGVKDLIAAPNLAANVNYGVDFANSSWYYHNSGTTASPSFTLVQKNFLQDQMLDVGENAAPTFIDYDNDGDQDMIIGAQISQPGLFRSSFKLFKNTGTIGSPKFVLENDDLFSFSLFGVINLKPQFADINSDGLLDFVFCATELTGFTTNIYYLLRTGANFTFSDQAQIFLSGLGTDENYKIYDINGDGLLDALVGKSTGRVEYYKNVGTAAAPMLTLDDNSFYGLDFSPFRQNTTCEIDDLDADGKPDLFTGDSRGNLTFYSDFLSNLISPLEGVTEFIQIEDETYSINFGSKIKPVAVNLFNADKPAIVLGTGQGGLVVLKNVEAVTNLPGGPIGLYPNPVPFNEELTIKSSLAMVVNILTSTGQVVIKNVVLPKGEEVKIDVSGLKEGLYLIAPIDGDGSASRFIVIR